MIVGDFSAFFAEFRGQRFTLLRRGSRNGFGARLSRPLRRPRVYSDTDPGHGREYFFWGHVGEVEIVAVERGAGNSDPKAIS
jgi:hypothetical protein